MSDTDMLSIILAIVGIGITIIGAIVGIGIAIIGVLGNNEFNKLSIELEGVEIKLQGELSRINSEVGRLREENAMKISDGNKETNYRVERLENFVFLGETSPPPQEPDRGINDRAQRPEDFTISKKGEFSYDKYSRYTR